MADARTDESRKDEGGESRLPAFGGTIFLTQAAHVAILDGRGSIMTVNDAWIRFGSENGLAASYRFTGVSYPRICERAIDAKRGGDGARAALRGINRVLAAEERRFSLIYPCHAPDVQRWFLMFARAIALDAEGAVVSHVDVTSLHQAGLLPDETARGGVGSSKRDADRLAQMIVPDLWSASAIRPPRLR